MTAKRSKEPLQEKKDKLPKIDKETVKDLEPTDGQDVKGGGGKNTSTSVTC